MIDMANRIQICSMQQKNEMDKTQFLQECGAKGYSSSYSAGFSFLGSS